MADNIQQHSEEMIRVFNQIKYQIQQKENFLKELENIKYLSKEEAIKRKKELLHEKSSDIWIKGYNKIISNLLKQLENENQKIVDLMELESLITTPEKIQKKIKKEKEGELEIIPPKPSKEALKYAQLTKTQLKKMLLDLNITHSDIKKFLKRYTQFKKEEGITKEEYSIYEPSEIGRIANKFLGDVSIKLTKKYPEFFKPLNQSLKEGDLKILPKTYVSIGLLFTILAFPLGIIIISILFTNITLGILLGIIITLLTGVSFYFYPASLIGGRRKKIKDDLPFALIHMSAVAGSGARPIDIFDLLLKSGEYRELGKEVNKIMNYTNLFGYDLTTALKNVSKTTPSPEFKELLNGMTSTIETGGDLKEYLSGKAKDTMNTYKLERKKYVKTLETFSDIYTAILIAAPLLFVVVLAIINTIGGGNIGGLPARTIALVGTYAALPLLNIGYMIFLTITQPEL